MRLTIFLIVFSVAAVIANTGHSQEAKISLQLKNATLSDVLNAIENNSSYYFMLNNKLIDLSKKIDIDVQDKMISEILALLSEKVGIKYKIYDRQIVLSPGDQRLSDLSVSQQQKSVSGKVTDSSGVPLPGVTVVVKGTNIGAITDANGKYSLGKVPDNATLQFSFVGMKTQAIVVTGKTIINIVMTEETVGIGEVVAIGYGTVKKSDLTGSVSSVQAKDLTQGANTSVNQMLQGKVAGLNLNSRTAQPGGAVSLNLRGYLSQLGSNNPLYVLDGVPLTYNWSATPGLSGNMGNYDGVSQDPLSTLNPSDIESVSILKDASATAIYGSSAANGVVIITTKKGKTGNVSVEYRGNYTMETPKSFYTVDDLLNAHDFMEQHELWAKENYLYQNKLAPYGNTNPSSVAPYVPKFSQSDIQNAGSGYDYMGMIMRKNANSQEHNITLTGGNDNTKIFSSFNYYDNNALLIPSVYQRYTGRLNLNQKISSRINFSVSSSFSSVRSNNATTTGNGAEQGDMVGAAIGFAPNIAPYDSEGNFSKTYIGQNPNPLSFLLLKNQSRIKRIFVAPNLTIKVSKELKLNIVGGVDEQTGLRNMYLPIKAQVPFLPDGVAQLNTNTVYNQSLESYFTFDKELKTSKLTIVGGIGKYNSSNEGYWVQAKGFTTDAFQDNNIAASDPAKTLQGSSKQSVTKLSGYYRVNYSVLDKYIFTLTGRADGSSNFAENHKWGFFPGAGIAWKASKEPFMKNITLISDLKFRVSYGSSGNDVTGANSMALYGTIPTATYLIGTINYPAVTLLQIANPNLTWETDITFNTGFDLSLLNDRIAFTYDYFIKTAKNLLDYNRLPYNNPVSRVAANVGTTQSMGHEIELTTKNIVSDKIKWSSHFTVSHYSANWVKRNSQYVLQPWETEKASLGAVYGLKTNGIIKDLSEIPLYQPKSTLGNIKYVKMDQSNSIIGAADVVKLFDNNSPWRFGFGNNFSYKSLDFSIFIYGTLRQYGWKYQVDGSPYAVESLNNTYKQVQNHWSSFNPSGTLPGIAPDPVNNPTGITDFGLTKHGGWARIKDISLGYKLPESLWNRIDFIKSLRLYVELQNVAVISRIYQDTDPEYSFTYPPAMSTTFGVTVNF